MPMSEEQREAARQRMKAMHAKKQAKKNLEATQEEKSFPDAVDGTKEAPEVKTTYSNADIEELMRQVTELKNQVKAQPQGIQADQAGRLIGTFEKYGVDPKQYPSPVERLSEEPRLQRFAFPLNYELVFNVAVSSYQTQDGINTKEPRFTLQLIKIVMDEDSGEPTNGRYMLYQMIFHEDPQAAIIIANDNGLPIDEENEADFLNEMRYLRMRDWLMDVFYPKPAQVKQGRKEMVIGNRLVEFYEISSEDKQPIPFSELSKKL